MAYGQFNLSIDRWTEIHRLPDGWPTDRLREVLQLAEFDDEVADDDALDMALMALQDLGVDDASDVVLQVVFKESMSAGVRQNLISDLEDDRPWEHVADVDKQSRIFEAVVLLQQAFPTRFGIPDAAQISITITSTDAETRQWLRTTPVPLALLARLLGSGMDEDAVLKRLYDQELDSSEMPNAGHILWHVTETDRTSTDAVEVLSADIVSSLQWLGPLQGKRSWTATGWPDGEHR